jgi:thiol-disulfide isomerase/thioredoxin
MARTMTIKLLALGLLVALVALPGCGGRGERAGEEGGAEEGTAQVEASSDVGVTEGKRPPSFKLPDLDGNEVALTDYVGKVVVLDLWATWCPPCRQEIPFLIELYEEHKDEGLVVVGVGLDDGGAGVLRPFVEQNGITYPILVGNRDVGQRYKLQGIPTTFILDRDGRIAAKHLGFRPTDAEVMREEVARLLGTAGEEA